MTVEQVLKRIREWYTDYSALTDLLESEDIKLNSSSGGVDSEEQQASFEKSRKKETKGGAMEQAFMAFMASRGLSTETAG